MAPIWQRSRNLRWRDSRGHRNGWMSGRARHIRWLVFGGTLAFGVAGLSARVASSRGLLDARAPTMVADLPAPPELDTSSIAAPVKLPLAPLAEELEQAVPKRFGSLDERLELPDRERTSLAFELRRAPFEMTVSGD